MAHFGPLNPPLLDEAAAGVARGEPTVKLLARLGIGRRTLTRWKAREDFQRRVAGLRSEAVSKAMGRAAIAANRGVAALERLLKSQNESVVLGAARALLGISGQFFTHIQAQVEVEQLRQTLGRLEAQILGKQT
jgi:hypothetical protein